MIHITECLHSDTITTLSGRYCLKCNLPLPVTPNLPGWRIVGPGTPVNTWLVTRHYEENGTNVCKAIIHAIGDEPEWVEREGGRTTVTHHSFRAPTHWKFLP